MSCEHPGCGEAATWRGRVRHQDGTECVVRAACEEHKVTAAEVQKRRASHWSAPTYRCTHHDQTVDLIPRWRRVPVEATS